MGHIRQVVARKPTGHEERARYFLRILYSLWLFPFCSEQPKDEKSMSSAERKARTYYHSCVDKNETIEKLGPKPMQRFLNKVSLSFIVNINKYISLMLIEKS